MTRREARVPATTAEGAEAPNFSRFLLSGEAILVGGKFVLEYARVPVKGKKKKGYEGKALLIVDPRDRVAIGTGKRTPEPVYVNPAAATSPAIIRTLNNDSFTLEIGDYKISIIEIVTSYNGGQSGLRIDSSTPLTLRKVGRWATVPSLREVLRRQLEQSPAKK